MFCTFIFAALLLKYCFTTADQLHRYFRLFLTVAKLLTTVTYYLMAWLNKPDDTRQARRHRSQNPPFKRKNLADIFYTDRVIANFVPNFVAMATGVGWGKMQLTAFDGASPKTPYRRKNFTKISYASRVKANFVPNFVAMATGVGRKKCS